MVMMVIINRVLLPTLMSESLQSHLLNFDATCRLSPKCKEIQTAVYSVIVAHGQNFKVKKYQFNRLQALFLVPRIILISYLV